ncbi:4Fe-4S binding protein [Barnesiella intestinihominis]
MDDNLCLSCQACVDGCPTHAIHAEIRNNIRETSTPRKETAIC